MIGLVRRQGVGVLWLLLLQVGLRAQLCPYTQRRTVSVDGIWWRLSESGVNERSMRCAGVLSWVPSELHVLQGGVYAFEKGSVRQGQRLQAFWVHLHSDHPLTFTQ